MTGPAIAGLILAAGASRRMGSPKALLPVRGQTFLDRMIGLFSPVCQPVVVVVGHSADAVRSGIRFADVVRFTVNPDPDRGMLSSIQCGLRDLPSTTAAVIFSPLDYPNCQSATILQISETYRKHHCDVVIPVYRGTHGHPVCISARVIEQILTLPTTAQARDAVREHRSTTVFIDVEDPGTTSDIDTPDDYQKLVVAQ